MHPLVIALSTGFVLAGAVELAVVRPFASSQEAKYFNSSFDTWNVYLPCNETPPAEIDLFLLYSRDLSTNAEAALGVNEIASEFQARNQSWHSCFRNLYVMSANLTEEEDVYDPRGPAHNPNWVNGPNSVFRVMLSSFIASNYSAFFMMEIDSVPRKEFWLEQFVEEVETSLGEVVISGSNYRGDNWDMFRTKMPEALLLHINGNAIYHLTHPLLAYISALLNAEADTAKNMIAFDVRIAEIFLELQADLQRVYNPESKLIGNYANTLLNKSFDSGTYITHGSPKNVFPELKESAVTLALSHADNANISAFEGSLDSLHPFRKVALLSKNEVMFAGDATGGKVKIVSTPRGASEVVWISAQEPEHMSLCEVASRVDTEFFVFGDTYHLIASPVSILMAGTAALLPFLGSNSSYCRTDPRCTSSLQQAERLFDVELRAHYDTQDTLFRSELVGPFCDAWLKASKGSSHTNCGLYSGPSADDYIAWMIAEGYDLETYYKQVNREVKGWRSWLLLHTAHPPDARKCGLYDAEHYRRMKGNISRCHQYVEQPARCDADAGCMWRRIFQSGRCIPFHMLLSAAASGANGTKSSSEGNTTTTTTTTTTATSTATALPADAAPRTPSTVVALLADAATRTANEGAGDNATNTSTTSSSTSSTSTTSSTTPLLDVAGSVLIPIVVERVTETRVEALLEELHEAAEAVRQGMSDANYVATPGVWVELSELFSVQLREPPNAAQLAIYADSTWEVRCGGMTRDQCDVQLPNATVGLKYTKGAKPRRLGQASSRLLQQTTSPYELQFEVFMIVRDAVDMRGTLPVDDPTFMPKLVEAVTQRVSSHAELSFNESSFPNTTTTVELLSSLTLSTASALTVVELSVPETAPIDFSSLQAEIANTSFIVEAMAANSPNTLLSAPSVDLCLGRTCGGHGICAAGTCLCDPGWSPPNCLLPITSPPSTSTLALLPATSPAPPGTTLPPLVVEGDATTQAAFVPIATLGGIVCCLLCCACLAKGWRRRQRKKKEDNNNKETEDNNNKETEEVEDEIFSDGVEVPNPVPLMVVSARPTDFRASEPDQPSPRSAPGSPCLPACSCLPDCHGNLDDEFEQDYLVSADGDDMRDPPSPIHAVRSIGVRRTSWTAEDEGDPGSPPLPDLVVPVDLEEEEEEEAAAEADEPLVADEAEHVNLETQELEEDDQFFFV